MKRLSTFRSLQRHVAYVVLRALLFLPRLVPMCVLVRVGDWLGQLAFLFPGRRHRIALRNADIVFGDELSFAQKRGILRRAAGTAVAGLLQTVRYCHLPPDSIDADVALEGEEHLRGALAAGRGVIAATGHFGVFPLLCWRLARRGYRVHVVVRHPHDERVARLFEEMRRRGGIHSIANRPHAVCARRCRQVLQNNEILMLQIDLHAGRRGVQVKFFGRPVSAFPGTVSLSLSTGAAIVPMFLLRQGLTTHLLRILPAFELERTGDRRADIALNTERLLRVLEEQIRSHPEQWWWLHRLWR